jgi:hypothetical protein
MKHSALFDWSHRLAVTREWVRLGGDPLDRRTSSSKAATRHIRRRHNVPDSTFRRWLKEARPFLVPFWPVHEDPLDLERAIASAMRRRWVDGAPRNASEEPNADGEFRNDPHDFCRPATRDPRYRPHDGSQFDTRGGQPEAGHSLLCKKPDEAHRETWWAGLTDLQRAVRMALDVAYVRNVALNEVRKDQSHGYVWQDDTAQAWSAAREGEAPVKESDELPAGLYRAPVVRRMYWPTYPIIPDRGRTEPDAGDTSAWRWSRQALRPTGAVVSADRVDIGTLLRSPGRTGWRWHLERYCSGRPGTLRHGPAVPVHEHPYRDAWALRRQAGETNEEFMQRRRTALATVAADAAAAETADGIRWSGYRWGWGGAPRRQWTASPKRNPDPFRSLRERWADRTYRGGGGPKI